MSTEGEGESELAPTIAAAAAFTFLNPHVYVDTLLLIGGASSRYVGDERLAFGIGAATASFVFFFSLGYGPEAYQRCSTSRRLGDISICQSLQSCSLLPAE